MSRCPVPCRLCPCTPSRPPRFPQHHCQLPMMTPPAPPATRRLRGVWSSRLPPALCITAAHRGQATVCPRGRCPRRLSTTPTQAALFLSEGHLPLSTCCRHTLRTTCARTLCAIAVVTPPALQWLAGCPSCCSRYHDPQLVRKATDMTCGRR